MRASNNERPSSRLRVLVLNRSYYPDVEATGQLLTELCGDLATDHDMTVVAGRPNFVNARGNGLIQRDRHDGVDIVRVRNLRFTKKSFVGRVMGLLSYLVMAFWVGLRFRKPALIIVQTDPPLLGVLGAILKRWHGCKLMYYLQDLYPEVGIILGKLRPGVVTSLLHTATQIGLRSADRVVVLGSDMRDRVIARGIDAEKIDIVPNWADTDLIQPSSRPSPLQKQWSPHANFVVMYSGNLGLSQNLEPLLDVAEKFRDEPVDFVLVGEGAAKEQLRQRSERAGLVNVRFLPYQPKDRLAESLGAADLHFIPLRRGLAGAIVPSKLYGILAAGVPYVAAVDTESETARVTAETGAGLVIPPDSAPALADALKWCLANRDRLPVMGRRGRQVAEEKFSRRICVSKMHDLISRTIEPTVPHEVNLSSVRLTLPRKRSLLRLSPSLVAQGGVPMM